MGRQKLREYRRKRDFSRTVEPEGKGVSSPSGRLYVIQKHDATRLHYDLRLEVDGVLKSWAVPKGPSLDPERKRMAVQVEDHPVEYGSFEGIIPEGEYGGGTVMIWDTGRWEPIGDPGKDLKEGRLSFRLHGKKLKGRWALARTVGDGDTSGKNWLIIKKRDEEARPEKEYDIISREKKSAASGRTMLEITKAKDRIWTSDASPARESQAKEEFDPSGLLRARPAAMPRVMFPQLATAVEEPPGGDAWLHEIKFDGYRMLGFIDGGEVRFLSRQGNDWTGKFKGMIAEVYALPVKQAILDGEMVVMDAGGRTNFQAMQNFLSRSEKEGLVYYLFDLPYLNGHDLSRVPLIHRKNLLKRVLEGNGKSRRLLYSDHFIGKGKDVYRHSCRFALEGIVSKHIDSPYVQKRSRQWQKVKCLNRQEFVVGGYTDPAGSRTGIGALLVGTFENGRFIYAGRVGTGFGSNMLKTLHRKLEPLERKGSPFEDPPAGGWARQAHWVKPEMVVEVEFANWTEDGRLRAPSFKGIREDKAAPEVHREEAVPGKGRPEEAYTDDDVSTDNMETAQVRREKARKVSPKAEARRKAGGSAEIAGVRLTNPGKVLYPEQGITKLALAQFYERVARFAVLHIRGRPLTLVRCPQGSGADCFFQKHFTESLPDFARPVSVREKGGNLPYIVVDDLPGVISLVQLGALEIHTWTCREDSLEQPDRMVFDLDPDKEVDWEHVIDAALAVRALLEELGLESFIKTTGGKGLHVVVPLTPRSSWEEVKAFSRGVAVTLVRTWPRKYIATMSKEKRRGKIFIDYFRNRRGATYIAAYSTRSRPGAPVSTPLRWEELGPAIGPDHFNINNLPGHLERMVADPWEGFFRTRQYLTKAMKRKLGIE